MKNIKIYVVGHKSFKPPKSKIYLPIQVGKKFSNISLPFLSDDTNDNIAEKNKNYCELTALYWIWKNDRDGEVLGLCHYRRYLCTPVLKRLLSRKKIDRDLQKFDIIIPKLWDLKEYTVREYYSHGKGKDKDLMMTRNIIEKMYPEYLISFDTVVNSREASYCNIFISDRIKFQSYCNWLFDILFELEKVTDLSGYTEQEARIYGYLSEILLNVWILHNQLIVKYYPIKIKMSITDKAKLKIRNFLKGLKKLMAR